MKVTHPRETSKVIDVVRLFIRDVAFLRFFHVGWASWSALSSCLNCATTPEGSVLQRCALPILQLSTATLVVSSRYTWQILNPITFSVLMFQKPCRGHTHLPLNAAYIDVEFELLNSYSLCCNHKTIISHIGFTRPEDWKDRKSIFRTSVDVRICLQNKIRAHVQSKMDILSTSSSVWR